MAGVRCLLPLRSAFATAIEWLRQREEQGLVRPHEGCYPYLSWIIHKPHSNAVKRISQVKDDLRKQTCGFARLLLSGYLCVYSQKGVSCFSNAENELSRYSQLKVRIVESATVQVLSSGMSLCSSRRAGIIHDR
jgi:hypothetical protein